MVEAVTVSSMTFSFWIGCTSSLGLAVASGDELSDGDAADDSSVAAVPVLLSFCSAFLASVSSLMFLTLVPLEARKKSMPAEGRSVFSFAKLFIFIPENKSAAERTPAAIFT